MNSNLYGKVWDFPQEMRNHMKVCFTKVNNADANTEGFNRNKRLQSASSIGYPELKRIKNDIDAVTQEIQTLSQGQCQLGGKKQKKISFNKKYNIRWT
jgi:hypothetical protein